MADTLLRSLGMLVEEKGRLVGREKQLAKAEHRLLAGLTRSLSGLGYRVLPVTGPEGQALAARRTRAARAYTRGVHKRALPTLRFYALRLHEAGMIKASPQKILAQGTDWRFLNELKKELKG